MTVRRDPAPAVAMSEGPRDGAVPPSASAPHGRAPDFFIVGQPKTARRPCTRCSEALSEYLNRDLVTLWGYDELD